MLFCEEELNVRGFIKHLSDLNVGWFVKRVNLFSADLVERNEIPYLIENIKFVLFFNDESVDLRKDECDIFWFHVKKKV